MMTPNSGDPLLRQRAEARQVADAEKTRFDELAVVTTAEGVVRSSRITELAEQQKAAYRRVSAARGRLTRARKDGDAEKIAAAARRLRELHAEADRITDTGIREAQHLISSELDNTGALIDQMGHTWDARAAVTDTYRTPPVPSSRRGEL
jgi:phage protein D